MRYATLVFRIQKSTLELKFSEDGDLTDFKRDGVDYSDDGEQIGRAIREVEQDGHNIQQAISVAFEIAPKNKMNFRVENAGRIAQ